jgi:hypothetical protein
MILNNFADDCKFRFTAETAEFLRFFTKNRSAKILHDSPVDLASIFSAGVLCGRWTTQTAAAEELQVAHSKLSRGVSVASLPREILNLFSSPKTITDLGAKTLLEILASHGL